MAKLTTQAGGVSFGRGIAAVAGLAMVMALSRILTREDYGTFRQVWLIFFTLAPVLDMGIPQSVSYFGPQLERSRRRTYLTQNGLALLVSGSLMALTFLTFASPVARLFGNPDIVVPLRAFALYPALTLSFNMCEFSLVTLGRAGTAGLVTGFVAVLQSAIILFAFLSGANLAQVFLYVSIWALLRWIVAMLSFLYIYRDLRVQWSWRELRGQLAFALPLGAAGMVGILGRQVDKLIVSSHFSPERYAVYANGSYDIPLIGILTMSVTAVLVPAIVRARAGDEISEVKRLWHGAARRVATLFFPVFAFLFVAAAPFIVLLFSEEYAESAAPFRVFLFLLPLRIAFHSGFLRALGRSGPIFVTSAGAMLISFLLAVTLIQIRALGFLGPALAVVIGAYAAAAYAIHVTTKTLGWRWRDYYPWKILTSIMTVALIAAIPTAIVGSVLASSRVWVQLAAMGGVYGAVYLIIGEATGVARTKEWFQAIADVVKQR